MRRKRTSPYLQRHHTAPDVDGRLMQAVEPKSPLYSRHKIGKIKVHAQMQGVHSVIYLRDSPIDPGLERF